MLTHIIERGKARVCLCMVLLSTLCLTDALLAQPALQPPADRNLNGDSVDPSVSDPVVRLLAKRNKLRIVERFVKVVELRNKIARVEGFDPEVIEVTALSLTQVRVQALAPGITTMTLVDENNDIFSVEVFVTGDVRHLQAFIDQLFPKSSVSAIALQDSVLLRGWVNQPEEITQISAVATEFFPRVINQIKVGGVQQVQLKVQIMEVQRSRIRRFGFNFLYLNKDGFISSTPGSLVPLSAFTAPFGGPPSVTMNAAQFGASSITGAILGDDFIFQGFLQALKEESLLKILAEPRLVTMNGRPANLLSGGEFPILVPQSLGSTTIEWREFGVRLEAVPIILGGGRVRLELQTEVSDRDFTNAVTTGGLTVPGLTTRRVNTQVEMRFGETFVLAGLVSKRDTAETQKIPFLGDMPWIGAAFRRVRYDENETETVILVTPQYVAPLTPSQVPYGGPGFGTESPTSRELYFRGFLEVPKYSERCIGCEPLGPSMFSPGTSQLMPHPAGNGGYSTSPGFIPPTPGRSNLAPGYEGLNGQKPTIKSKTGEPSALIRGRQFKRSRWPWQQRSSSELSGQSSSQAPNVPSPFSTDPRPASTDTDNWNNDAEEGRSLVSPPADSPLFERPQLIEPRPGLIEPDRGLIGPDNGSPDYSSSPPESLGETYDY